MFTRRKSTRSSSLNRLLGLVHSSHPVPQRVEAIDALGNLADPQIIPLLAAALNDPDRDIVAAAGHALTRIAVEYPEAIKPLVGALLRQLWNGSVYRLVEKFTVFRPLTIVDALIATVEDQLEEIPIQINAMAGLAAMAHPDSLDFLLDVCEDPTRHSQLRELALLGLMRCNAQQSEGWLAEVLEAQSNLIRLPVAAVFAQAVDAAPLPILASLLYHPDWSLRKRAAEELGTYHHPAALPALLDNLHNDHPQVRQQVIIALAEIGHHDALAPLLECFLTDETNRVRLAAHDALRRFQFDDHDNLKPHTDRLVAALDAADDYATSWLIRRLSKSAEIPPV